MQWQNSVPFDGAPTPGQNQPQQAAQGLEITHVLAILIDRYKIILGTSILGLLLGIALSLMTKPMYLASALLQFDPGVNEVLAPGLAGSRGAYAKPSQEAMATQIGLLQSESLARRVAQDLRLATDPAYGGETGTLAERTERAASRVVGSVSAEPIKNSLLIRLNVVSDSQEMAARIANGFAQGHITSSLERKFGASSYARDFLSNQLARTKASLEESERSLNSYAIQAGIFKQTSRDGSGKESDGGSLTQSDLSTLNSALKQAEIARIGAEQRYLKSEVAFASEGSTNFGPLIQQRAALQAEYDEKLKTYKPDYPAMVELNSRIKRLDSEIVSERNRTSGNRRAELRGEYQAAVRVEAALRQKVAQAKGEVLLERGRSIQYNILQREADTNRTLYDALLQRYKEVGVTGGIGQSDVILIDQAKVPRGAFRPRPFLNAMAGLIGGLVLGIALAIAMHLLFDTIRDASDVRSKLHLPLLGSIPVEPEGIAPIEALADRKSELSEAYHSARTSLRFSRPEGMPKSVLVTSARPGEGKSTSAYAIAQSEAILGRRVLLIDADLRKPSFTSARTDGKGLGHLLTSEDPISTAIEKTSIKHLSLLPAGKFSGAEAELLSSNRLPCLVKEAVDAFDFVVIDAPPILGLADAPLLASVVEATVLVIESRSVRTADIQDMIRRLTDAGARIAGVVLTKVVSSRNRYGYGYGYGYGSSQADSDEVANANRRISVT